MSERNNTPVQEEVQNGESLSEVLVRTLRENGLHATAAESCTGVLAAKRLTDVPGASAVFLGGVVSYTNAVKQHVLGVPASLLETYGAEALWVYADGSASWTGGCDAYFHS